jgi:hypothetical protein
MDENTRFIEDHITGKVRVEGLFFMGMYEQFVNHIEAGTPYKNIKDRSKIARRFARFFNQTIFKEFYKDRGYDPEKCRIELISLADMWDMEKKILNPTKGSRQRRSL